MASISQPTSLSSRRKSTRALQTMPSVSSSFITLFEYDEANSTLTTHMMNGAIYQHKDVSPGDWSALQTSQNHSKHWSNAIRGKKLSVNVKSAKAPNSGIKTGRKKK